jgi:hypothetical protein
VVLPSDHVGTGSLWLPLCLQIGVRYPSSHSSTHRPPQPTPMSLGERRVSQQVIVEFKPNTIACDAAGIASLSSATQVPLRHVRPMPGDAYVIQQLADDAAGLSQGQETLKQHPAIEWLEDDRMMHPFLRNGWALGPPSLGRTRTWGV